MTFFNGKLYTGITAQFGSFNCCVILKLKKKTEKQHIEISDVTELQETSVISIVTPDRL